MAYELYIGDRTFSNWSLRGWLMLKSFDIPFKSQMLGLYNGTFEKDLAPLAPARQVPISKAPKGHIVFDTLAIAETLAEAHPSAARDNSDFRCTTTNVRFAEQLGHADGRNSRSVRSGSAARVVH